MGETKTDFHFFISSGGLFSFSPISFFRHIALTLHIVSDSLFASYHVSGNM